MATAERPTRKKLRTPPRDAEKPASEPADERRQRIAEEAYYNAERRGFEGNLEVEDWLEAERLIDSRASGAGIQHEASIRSEGPSDTTTATLKEERDPVGNGELIEPDQVKQWAKRLKVPAARLREAIARVGPGARDVMEFLKQP